MITLALWYLLIGGILSYFVLRRTKPDTTLTDLVVIIAFWPIVSLMVLFDIEILD